MAAIQRRSGLFGIGLASALFLGWGIVSAGAAVPPASPVHLVHDFFSGEFEGDRPLPQLTRLAETLFFVTAELETGQTVWRTDGTAAGSHRVPIAGAAGVLDDAKIIGTVGGHIFWTARSAADPERRALLAAGESGDAAVLTTCFYTAKPFEGRLFFVNCAATGHGIWSTDGTAAGTGPVAALAGQGDVGSLETLAGRWLVFSKGSALLAWDVARARVLRLLEGQEIGEIHPTGETLFVITWDKNGQRQRLWASRLDAPRALQLFTAPAINIAGWRDGRFYFGLLADSRADTVRLWSTDGTLRGTRPYTGLRPDAFGFLAGQLGAIGSTTLVPVPGYYSGGLLAADETKHEVREIVSACKGKYPCLGSSMSDVTVIGGQAFEAINRRLVRSDGTAEGSAFGSGLVQVDAASLGVVDGHLLLGAVRQGVQQLWETDGTAAGTKALSDGTRDRPFRVEGPPIAYNGALFAAADRKPVGQQLWRIAGGRTEPVTDLRHLATGVFPFQAFPVGDRILLNGSESYGWKGVAADGSAEEVLDYDDVCSQALDPPCTTPTIAVGRRRVFLKGFELGLWTTDGTAAGTVPVTVPEGGILEPAALGRLGEGALVLTQSGGLWSSDGSPEGGSRFIAQLPFNPNHPERFRPVFAPVALGASTFLFRRAPGPGGPGTSVLEVWRTDGTAAGTLRLASTPFLDSYSSELSPAVLGGRLFFRFGGTIWMSDGSAEGTRPLPAQLPGGTFTLAAGSGTLYAGAGYQDADAEHETLWAIDPSTLTASLLGTFPQVSDGGVGANLGRVLGDTLFFGVDAPQGETPEKVWLTEGTAASTRPLPDPLSSLTAASFFSLGDRRYFAACEAEHGCELWSADRLGETPELVADLWPGPRGSDPEILAVDGRSLLFAATEPSTGRELWKLDLPAAWPPSAARVQDPPTRLVSPRHEPARKLRSRRPSMKPS
jgi:ELWxxDGT repeat protein